MPLEHVDVEDKEEVFLSVQDQGCLFSHQFNHEYWTLVRDGGNVDLPGSQWRLPLSV